MARKAVDMYALHETTKDFHCGRWIVGEQISSDGTLHVLDAYTDKRAADWRCAALHEPGTAQGEVRSIILHRRKTVRVHDRAELEVRYSIKNPMPLEDGT